MSARSAVAVAGRDRYPGRGAVARSDEPYSIPGITAGTTLEMGAHSIQALKSDTD